MHLKDGEGHGPIEPIDAVDEACRLFSTGLNCTQALLMSFGGRFGLLPDTARRLGAAMGGGMAGTGDVCGAVTGGLLVLGLRYGGGGVLAAVRKRRAERKGAEFIKRFKDFYGTTGCSSLLGGDRECRDCKPEGRSEACAGFVLTAAELLEDML